MRGSGQRLRGLDGADCLYGGEGEHPPDCARARVRERHTQTKGWIGTHIRARVRVCACAHVRVCARAHVGVGRS